MTKGNYSFKGSNIQLAESEEVLLEVEGGLRAVGNSKSLPIFPYYVLRHRRDMLLTTKRIVVRNKKTRDHDLTTIPLDSIATIAVKSDWGFLIALQAVVGMLIAFAMITAPFTLEAEGDDDAMVGFILLALGGIPILLASVWQWVNRTATLVVIESTGGSNTVYTISGSKQKNKITACVDKINALRMGS